MAVPHLATRPAWQRRIGFTLQVILCSASLLVMAVLRREVVP